MMSENSIQSQPPGLGVSGARQFDKWFHIAIGAFPLIERRSSRSVTVENAPQRATKLMRKDVKFCDVYCIESRIVVLSILV